MKNDGADHYWQHWVYAMIVQIVCQTVCYICVKYYIINEKPKLCVPTFIDSIACMQELCK